MNTTGTNGRSAPAYKQLAQELRTALDGGEYPAGSRLPTEFELAAQHRVSRQTVRHAFSELVAEGLVYRVQGRGTFATPAANRGSYLRSFGSIDELLALSVDTQLELVQPFALTTDIEAARELELDSDRVFAGTFRRLHEEVVFCVTTTFLPPAFASVLSTEEALLNPGSRSPTTIIGLIERYADIPVMGAHQRITAIPAPKDVAALIECRKGDAVLRIDRTYYDRDGAIVEFALSYFNPLRYSYRVELRRTSS